MPGNSSTTPCATIRAEECLESAQLAIMRSALPTLLLRCTASKNNRDFQRAIKALGIVNLECISMFIKDPFVVGPPVPLTPQQEAEKKLGEEWEAAGRRQTVIRAAYCVPQ